MEVDRVEADVFADEILELAGGNFAEAFEARDFVAGAERVDGGLLLLLGVTVASSPSCCARGRAASAG